MGGRDYHHLGGSQASVACRGHTHSVCHIVNTLLCLLPHVVGPTCSSPSCTLPGYWLAWRNVRRFAGWLVVVECMARGMRGAVTTIPPSKGSSAIPSSPRTPCRWAARRPR